MEVIHVNLSICYLLGTWQWAAVSIVLFWGYVVAGQLVFQAGAQMLRVDENNHLHINKKLKVGCHVPHKSGHQQHRSKSKSSQRGKQKETSPTFMDIGLNFTDTVLMGLNSIDSDHKEGKEKWSTSVRFWNDLCWVRWERGNNPTKVLYNCRKMYSCKLISQLQKKGTTAISFHDCKILRRNNRKNGTTAISFTTAKKLYNCKTNAQRQINVQLWNKFIAILMRMHLQDILHMRNYITSVIFPCLQRAWWHQESIQFRQVTVCTSGVFMYQ